MRPLKGITVVLAVALLPFLFAACSSDSTTSTTPTSTPLAAPTSLVAEQTTDPIDNTLKRDSLTVQWRVVPGASSYHLYYSKTTPVDPTTAEFVDNAVPPLTLEKMAAGKYYFVVTAVYPEGESAPSEEVSVEILQDVTAGVPEGVTAFNTAEVTNSITIQWWDVLPTPAGYNIYRGTEAGLALYYKDSSKAKKIPNALAPYIDTDGIIGGTTYYYVVTSFDSSGVESAPSGEASVKARGSRDTGSDQGGGGGEDDTGFGNNLSFPVVFADNVGVTGLKITGAWPGVVTPTTPVPAFDFNTGLRPLSTEVLPAFPYFEDNTSVLMGGVTYYPQATASTWQAEWRANPAGDNLSVIVDWGDALASKTYTTNSVVRIETILLQDSSIVTDTMTAFNMKLLAGSGATEMQGADSTTYPSAIRHVFAVNPRLIIQKLAPDNTVECEVYNNSVWQSLAAAEEGGEEGGGGPPSGTGGGGPPSGTGGGGSGGAGGAGGGPPTGTGGGGSGAYAGELNVGGKLVYGYNFMINTLDMATACNNGNLLKTGTWKILFQLDNEATIAGEQIPNHVKIVGKTDATAEYDTLNGTWSYMLISVQ